MGLGPFGKASGKPAAFYISRDFFNLSLAQNFDFVLGKPKSLSISADAVPGSTIMQQPSLKIASLQSASTLQVYAAGVPVGAVFIKFK